MLMFVRSGSSHAVTSQPLAVTVNIGRWWFKVTCELLTGSKRCRLNNYNNNNNNVSLLVNGKQEVDSPTLGSFRIDVQSTVFIKHI